MSAVTVASPAEEATRAGTPRVKVLAADPVVGAHLVGALAEGGLEATVQVVSPERLTPELVAGADLLVLAPEGEPRRALRVLRRLRPALAGTRVVVVTELPANDDDGGVLRDPVDGVVRLDRASDALAPTAWAVLADQVVVPRASRRLLAPVLSRRERQVLALMALGASNPAIAQRLFLSESTIKSHLTSAFAKLGVSSRNEAATLLLDPDEPLGPVVMAALDGPAPEAPAATLERAG